MNKISAALALTLAALLLCPSARAVQDKDNPYLVPRQKAADRFMKMSCAQLSELMRGDDYSKPSYDRVDIQLAYSDKGCGNKDFSKVKGKERDQLCAQLDKDFIELTKRLPRNTTERQARAKALRQREALKCPGPVPHAASSH